MGFISWVSCLVCCLVFCLVLLTEYEAMQDKIELYEDIEISIAQINVGEGISHEAAKEKVLKRLNK